MRFFILKRKTFHTNTKKEEHAHAHFTCARVNYTPSPLFFFFFERTRPFAFSSRALITSVEKSRVSREKRDVSFFLFVS
jgi:hypothetical protein